jgi:hypothetical protein
MSEEGPSSSPLTCTASSMTSLLNRGSGRSPLKRSNPGTTRRGCLLLLNRSPNDKELPLTLPRRKFRARPRRRGPEPEWPECDPRDDPEWLDKVNRWFDWVWSVDRTDPTVVDPLDHKEEEGEGS